MKREIKSILTKMYLYFVSTFGVAAVIANGWVFNAIKHRKSYPSRYAQANAIISSTMVFIMELINALEMHDGTSNNLTVQRLRKNYYGCKWWSVYTRTSVIMTSFTVVQIFAEITLSPNSGKIFTPKTSNRFRLNCLSLEESESEKQTSQFLIFVSTWVCALTLSVPSFAAYEFTFGTDETSAMCKNVPLFGSEIIYVIYDVMSAVIVAFYPSIYMVHVFYSLNFSVEFLFLFKSIPEGMNGHIRKIRVAFFHMLFFMMSWMPMGALWIQRRFIKLSPETKSSFANGENFFTFRFLLFLQFLCQPFLSIYAHFGLSMPVFMMKFWASIRSLLYTLKIREESKNCNLPLEVSVSAIPMETVQATQYQMT